MVSILEVVSCLVYYLPKRVKEQGQVIKKQVLERMTTRSASPPRYSGYNRVPHTNETHTNEKFAPRVEPERIELGNYESENAKSSKFENNLVFEKNYSPFAAPKLILTNPIDLQISLNSSANSSRRSLHLILDEYGPMISQNSTPGSEMTSVRAPLAEISKTGTPKTDTDFESLSQFPLTPNKFK